MIYNLQERASGLPRPSNPAGVHCSPVIFTCHGECNAPDGETSFAPLHHDHQQLVSSLFGWDFICIQSFFRFDVMDSRRMYHKCNQNKSGFGVSSEQWNNIFVNHNYKILNFWRCSTKSNVLPFLPWRSWCWTPRLILQRAIRSVKRWWNGRR